MDTGVGMWDNIPPIVRQAFRGLLTIVEDQQRQMEHMREQLDAADAARATDSEAVVVVTQKQEAAARKAAADATAVHRRLDAIEGALPCKADAEAVRTSLQLKADRTDVAALSSSLGRLERESGAVAASAAALPSQLASLSAEHTRFREEAQAGIIAATRAANEARTAVAASISAASLQASSYAAATDLQSLRSDVAALSDASASTREALAGKADIAAVNDVLETKANKTTVAQALHNKLSTSKLPDAISPLATRVTELEKQLAVLAATHSASAAAVAAAAADTRRAAASGEAATITAALVQQSQAIAEIETKLNARMDEVAAATATRATAAMTAADCTAAREGVESLRVELDAHVRRTEALLAETRSRLEAAETAVQRQPQFQPESRPASSAPTPRATTPAPASTTSTSATAASNARSASAQHRRAALGLMPPGASVGDSAAPGGASGSPPPAAPPPASDIHVQLSCTRSDLQALSQEVGAIVALLEAGDVDVRTLAMTAQRALHDAVGATDAPSAVTSHASTPAAPLASAGRDAAAAPMHVSATTAVTSLRSTVATLQERLFELERVVDQLRLEVSSSRAEAVETRDMLLRCAAAGRQADGSIRSLADRTSELEAAFRVLAPMAMQQHQQLQRAAGSWPRAGTVTHTPSATADAASAAAPATLSAQPAYASGSGAVQLSTSVPAAPPQPPASAAEHAGSSRSAPATTHLLSPSSAASASISSPGPHLSAISAAVAHLPTAVDLPLRQRYSLLGGGGGPELSALLPTAAPASARGGGGAASGCDPIVTDDASSMPKWRDTHAPLPASVFGAASASGRSGSRASSPPAVRHAGLPVTLHGRGW